VHASYSAKMNTGYLFLQNYMILDVVIIVIGKLETDQSDKLFLGVNVYVGY